MNNRLLWIIVGLVLVAGSLTAFSWHPVPAQSVCTLSDSALNGPGAQENDAYCAGVNIAPSTYLAAIAYAQAKAVIVGTPERVYTCHDFHRVLRVCVDFSRGFQAQHLLVCCASKTVWIYDPYSKQVWP